MLRDRKQEVEGRGRRIAERKALAQAFGSFIAELAPWDWFINPITFRDQGLADAEQQFGRGSAPDGATSSIDPRIATWRPTQRGIPEGGPPVPDAALKRITAFLGEMQIDCGGPIGWVIGEEFGRIGGRYHCHLLVSGVAELRRDFWWQRAFDRFGRTRIEPFDPERGAAFYTAKYAAKQLGGLHFGGMLRGVDLSKLESRPSKPGGRVVIARSAELPRDFFRMLSARRHR